MRTSTILTLGIAAVLIAGCDRKAPAAGDVGPDGQPLARTPTFETHALRKAIDTFEKEPTAVQAARVKKAFAEIDSEIAELVEQVLQKEGDAQAEASRKLGDLRTFREAEQVRFLRLEALAPAVVQPVPPARREGTAEKVGGAIDDAARKLDEKARDAADALREKLK